MSQTAADWDMTPYFAAHGAADFESFRKTLETDARALSAELESAPAIAPGTVPGWRERLRRLEDIGARLAHLGSYLECIGAADAADEAIARDTARHAGTQAMGEKLFVLARAALGAASDADYRALVGDPQLESIQYFLGRLRYEAARSMAVELEALAADLSVDGLAAWGRLYDQISGSLELDLTVSGKTERKPVAMTRTFLEDADPEVRRAAFAGAAVAWESVATPVAASLNAIAGTRHTLYQRRGIEHFLEPALFDAGIERKTLDCMMEVVRARQSLPQAFLRHKARLLGQERLDFCDLMAPLPGADDGRIPWAEGARRVQDAFDLAYPALGGLARMAFRDRWIDHAPRSGKRPGGFCSSSQVIGQSRIFMTYNGAMGDVQTLAHELGHAFHSYLLRELRPWASNYPMPLAETASTFAENLVTNQALSSKDTPDSVKRSLLEQRLQDGSAFLLNIPMRFDFEYAFYEQRKQGELPVSAIKELMLDAQRKNYGDSLNPSALDPMFWASKLHFYITEISFYNFPYTFGYLFSMGLFARFLEQGSAFLPRYEELLQKTGTAAAETIARDTLGVDLQKPDFWNASIDLIERDWQQFQELT